MGMGGNEVVGKGDLPRTGVPEPAPAAAAPGMVVHFDPATGRIVETPTPEHIKDLAALLAPVVNMSDEGLQAEASQVPGGGMVINLQGRFQNTSVAVVDDNGDLTAPCLPGAPASDKDGE
jgi:hypothetical protein